MRHCPPPGARRTLAKTRDGPISPSRDRRAREAGVREPPHRERGAAPFPARTEPRPPRARRAFPGGKHPLIFFSPKNAPIQGNVNSIREFVNVLFGSLLKAPPRSPSKNLTCLHFCRIGGILCRPSPLAFVACQELQPPQKRGWKPHLRKEKPAWPGFRMCGILPRSLEHSRSRNSTLERPRDAGECLLWLPLPHRAFHLPAFRKKCFSMVCLSDAEVWNVSMDENRESGFREYSCKTGEII